MQSSRLAFCSLLTLVAPLAFSQALPQFEVASIKASAPSADFKVNLGYHIDGAMVSCRFLSLKDYVRMAYQVKYYQVSGPEWLASTGFDITAKLPDGGKESQVRDMFKALLTDRFHMKLHRESKDFPVYGLMAGKGGLKLTESAVDPAAESQETKPAGTNVAVSGGPEGVNLNLGGGSSFAFADNLLTAKKLTMPAFAELLARFVDRPVVEMTGLTGTYDFELKVTSEDYMAMQIRAAIAAGITLPPQALRLLETSSGDSLASALQGLGLKLDPRKAPLEVLVVDQADKIPTDN